MANDNFQTQGLDSSLYKQDFSYDIANERAKLAQQKEYDGTIEDKGYSEEVEQALRTTPDFNVTISQQAQQFSSLESINKTESKEQLQQTVESQQLSATRNRTFVNQTESAQQYVNNIQQQQSQERERVQNDIDQRNSLAFDSPQQQEEVSYQQTALEQRRNQSQRIIEQYQLNSRLETNQPSFQEPVNSPNFVNAATSFNQNTTDFTSNITQTNPRNTESDTLDTRIQEEPRQETDNTNVQQSAGDETSVQAQRIDREERFAPPPNRDTPDEVVQQNEDVQQQTEQRQDTIQSNDERANQNYLDQLRAQSDAIIERYREGNIFE